MRKRIFLLLAFFISALFISAQSENENKPRSLTPYIGTVAGGCGIDNPFSFFAGMEKQKAKHISFAYDIYYQKTDYTCYCDDMYSEGNFRAIVPSFKIVFNSGKKNGKGLIAGVGLGYMFAKDRGTEQSYSTDPLTSKRTLSGNIVNGNWDFSSISPSITIGAGIRLLRFPVSGIFTVYYANTTEGWGPVTGGAGIKIGFKRAD